MNQSAREKSVLTGRTWQSRGIARGFGMLAAAAIVSVGLCDQSFAATKVEKTFGSWLVTCVEDNAVKHCNMSQQRMTEKQKKVVFAWLIGSTATKELVNNLTVPSAVSIKEGVRVAIGTKPQINVPYDVCLPGRCAATFPLDAAVLQTMSSSATATVTYVLASRKLMQVQIDLKDFPKAYEYFKSQL